MIKVICPTCKEEIQEADYNIATKLAQCVNCDSIFNFDIKEALTYDKSYKEVKKPDNIHISTFPSGGQMILNYSSKMKLIQTTVVTAITLIILYFLFTSSFSFSNVQNFLPLLIPIAFVAFSLNQYYKKAIIRIEDERLSITIKSPLTIGNSHWTNQTKTIKQIFVKKRIVTSDESSTTYFDLGIEVQNGRIDFPLKNFRTTKELYFIEVELEKLLGIIDVQHAQEMSNHSLAPQNFKEAKMLAKELYRSYKKSK